MKGFNILEAKIEVLQKELKELNELQDHLTKQRYDLWNERAQAHKDHKDLKISKHGLWIKCENQKKYAKFLNDKLLKNKDLKGQPQDVENLNEEIDTLKTTIVKFVRGTECLDKLLRYSKCHMDKFGHRFEGKYMFMMRILLFVISMAKSGI